MEFEMHTVRDGYVALIRTVRDFGKPVSPRGLPCRELMDLTLVVNDPVSWAMPVGLGRKLNPAIGAAEALQLLSGVSDPQLMLRISSNFDEFMDEGHLYGAYGPRVAEFLPTIQALLERDPDTRQAVIPIWRPQDVGAVTKDLPCTLDMQFMIRDGRLNMRVNMRSNDVVWGWSYDAFQFTRVQLALADALGVNVGRYVHHAGSFHLYERDLELVDKLEYQELSEHDWLAPAIRVGKGSIRHHQAIAMRILSGHALGEDVNHWFYRTLEPYL